MSSAISTDTQPTCIPLIEKLIGFDTTSRNSNLDLIEFIQGELSALGIKSELVYDNDRRKANLFATIGPADKSGIVLSGHTDVVPVDGQDWDTDPYQVVSQENRLFGRGTSDMKSFIAICLHQAKSIQDANLETPIHFAFSYDEEIGCIGVRGLLEELAQRPIKPHACIVGEPTNMQVIRAHKGKLSQRCTVHGHECHSGMTHKGVNAVEAAAETIVYLKNMARHFRDTGPFDSEFDPPYTTVHTGTISGGTALNIVPKECTFEFEFRHLPIDNPTALLQQVQEFTERQLMPEMRQISPSARFEWQLISSFPGMSTDDDADLTRMVKKLTNSTTSGKVSFGTEGGLFQAIGIPAIVCGPGNIAQAHKPNEFIDIVQITKCEKFIKDLISSMK